MDPLLWQTIFGLGAIVFTGGSFVPQVIKSWKSKSVNDLSWLMIVVHMLANICWLGYGILRLDPVIIATDSFVLFVLLILTFVKYKYQT